MLNLSKNEIAVIEMRLDRALRSLEVGKDRLARQRVMDAELITDCVDQVALVEAISKVMPDPAVIAGKIDAVKQALNAFEDLVFNAQDKAELLEAIAARPNVAADALGCGISVQL